MFALQGHNAERDHLDEAVARDGVAGTVPKAGGIAAIAGAVREVAAGRSLRTEPPAVQPTIHQWFVGGRRGETAARMAGAIAAGRAANHDTPGHRGEVLAQHRGEGGREVPGPADP